MQLPIKAGRRVASLNLVMWPVACGVQVEGDFFKTYLCKQKGYHVAKCHWLAPGLFSPSLAIELPDFSTFTTSITCPDTRVSSCTESSEHEEKSAGTSGEPSSQPYPAPVYSQPEEVKEDMDVTKPPKPEENDEFGPLPDNWEMAYTEKGEVYFIE